jgi:hypothetical protein
MATKRHYNLITAIQYNAEGIFFSYSINMKVEKKNIIINYIKLNFKYCLQIMLAIFNGRNVIYFCFINPFLVFNCNCISSS